MRLKSLAIVCAAVAFVGADCAATRASATNPAATSSQLPKSADNLNWVRYTDSSEGAFSIEVPVGWQVQGGMYRFGYFDVRWMMDIRSLDGKVILRIDDVNVPPYALPGPHTGREGQPYSKPQQFQMIVSNYREGQAYAELYGKRRFSSVCKTLNSRQPDWTPGMPAAWKNDPGTKSSEGGVAYNCDTSDGPRIASVYVRTSVFPSSGFWVVDPVISILAAPDNMALAHSMVQHMIDSWQKNPQWEEYQKQVTQMGLNQIKAGFQQFMQQMQAYHQARTAAMNQQVAGFEAHQNAQAQQVTGWGETLTGIETVSDPQTGNQFQIFSGPKANNYINGMGVTVNSNISPGPGFRQLTPVQH
jgi:hypothetical protein